MNFTDKKWSGGLRGLIAFTLGSLLVTARSYGCACGCGMNEVGTSSMLPMSVGTMAYTSFDYLNQDKNWSGSTHTAASLNPDKTIRTEFYTLGVQTMVSEVWGYQVEVPYEHRMFKTTGGATGDDLVHVQWSGLGDARLQGIFTGLSSDFTTGITFGLKLPTGSSSYNDKFGDLDRDTELGSGSTDLLLGGYNRFEILPSAELHGFSQIQVSLPLATKDHYTPGVECNLAVGVYTKEFRFDSLNLVPLFVLKAGYRGSDKGANSADPVASGYKRILAAPGVEMHMHPFKVHADIEMPVYQNVVGQQLVSSALVHVSVSYMY
jgi:hypothetical protein